MKPTQQLHDHGQSLWLDNITRGILNDGTLQRYIRELSVTGLTSNPTIFDHAITKGDFYDDAIRRKAADGKAGEALFFELATEDLMRAADLFRPVHDRTSGVDGWVSLEVSPLLANDTAATIRAAAELHGRAQRPNLFIKIPGTLEGLPAIEDSIFGGVPVNVTLLFSAAQYVAAAEAYMRGIERRLAAGRDPRIGSVASPAGARPQRLLWASTSTKDPEAPDTLYVEALAAPDTVNTIPDKTLQAFADHGHVKGVLPVDGGDAEAVLAEFRRAGVDETALAARLQREGTASFDKSWNDLLQQLEVKRATLAPRDRAAAGKP